MFNKLCEVERVDIEFPKYFYFEITEWVWYTNEEKKIDEEKKIIGGYLKKYKYKEVWRRSFENADVEDVRKTLKLPNFDYAIFEEISGIRKEMIDKKIRSE